jgi:hypothetical protein
MSATTPRSLDCLSRPNWLSHLGSPILAVIVTASLAWMLAVPAVGQEAVTKTTTATIETVAYQPIPPGSRLLTQPDTQSEMDDEAWRQVDANLSARGYALGNDSNMVVTIATQLVPRLTTDRPVRDVNAEKSDPRKANLFSTEGGTLLNPNDPVNTTDRVFRVNMTVYDRPSGHYIWRGTVERGDAAVDPSTAMRVMLPALLDHFGESASGVVIPIKG